MYQAPPPPAATSKSITISTVRIADFKSGSSLSDYKV
jgi:hypothetical protein